MLVFRAKNKVFASVCARKNIHLEIIPCRDRLTAFVPTTDRMAIFARILLPELLPAEKRALYLDCDITVISDLHDMFNFDLQGAPLAAFIDMPETAQKETRLWGADFGGKYFNSGVMVMDLERWRDAQAAEKVSEFGNKHGFNKGFPDQAALNHVFFRQVTPLNPRWQFTFDDPDWKHVKLIHYGFAEKPWVTSKSPFTDIYLYHRRATPFPNFTIRGVKTRRLKVFTRWIGAKLGHARYRKLQNEYAAHQRALVRARALVGEAALRRAKMIS